MISISEKSRSAVLALTELARRGDAAPVPILELAESRDIPLHFLEQLLAGLRRAGILQSQRGVKGGYSFRRDPAEVTILEIVETVDGRIRLDDDGPPVAGDWVWRDARSRLADLFGELTIADMAEREARDESAPMFHI